MLHALTYPRKRYDERALDKQLILKLIMKHQSIIAKKMFKNKRYYDGVHDILQKKEKRMLQMREPSAIMQKTFRILPADILWGIQSPTIIQTIRIA